MKYRETSAEYIKQLPLRKRSHYIVPVQQHACEIPQSSASSFSITKSEAVNGDLPPTPPNVPLVLPDAQAKNSSSSTVSSSSLENKQQIQAAIASGKQQQQNGSSNSVILNNKKRNILTVEKPRAPVPPQRLPKVKKEKPQRVVEDEDDESSDSSSDEDDGKIYCICKTKYNPNLWMICCDICNEWYHGRCVQVTANEARKIKVYACPVCREKDSSLQIEYKVAKKKKLGENGESKGSPESASSSPAPNEQTPQPMDRPAHPAQQQQQQQQPSPNNQANCNPQQLAKSQVAKKRKKTVISDDDPSNDQPNESSAKRRKSSELDAVISSITALPDPQNLPNCTVQPQSLSNGDASLPHKDEANQQQQVPPLN